MLILHEVCWTDYWQGKRCAVWRVREGKGVSGVEEKEKKSMRYELLWCRPSENGYSFLKRDSNLGKVQQICDPYERTGEVTKYERDLWKISSYSDDEEYFMFTISHLLVVFYALSIVHSLGFAMFLLELLHHSYLTNRQPTHRRKITERFS